MTAGFLAANVPFLFRFQVKPSDPETPPPISPRCAGVTALHLVAQWRSWMRCRRSIGLGNVGPVSQRTTPAKPLRTVTCDNRKRLYVILTLLRLKRDDALTPTTRPARDDHSAH